MFFSLKPSAPPGESSLKCLLIRINHFGRVRDTQTHSLTSYCFYSDRKIYLKSSIKPLILCMFPDNCKSVMRSLKILVLSQMFLFLYFTQCCNRILNKTYWSCLTFKFDKQVITWTSLCPSWRNEFPLKKESPCYKMNLNSNTIGR